MRVMVKTMILIIKLVIKLKLLQDNNQLHKEIIEIKDKLN